jgi:hypothetical protein
VSIAAYDTLAAVECADHPGKETTLACSSCKRAMCDACATFTIDDASSCEACGRDAEDRARSLGSGLLALVGVGYLVTLAVGVVAFKPRPFIGGVAAVVAIVLGRFLQRFVRSPRVSRRSFTKARSA